MHSLNAIICCLVLIFTKLSTDDPNAFKNCFFFTQRTAYEFRSSYWSSDVCSSDLLAEDVVDDRGGHLDGVVALHHPGRLEALEFECVDEVLQRQIGRASCRERVCQYV